MIFDHQFANMPVYAGSTVEVGFDITNDIASTDSASSVVVVVKDDEGTTVTTTVVSATGVSGNIAYAIIHSLTANRTYELEFEITTAAARVLTRFVTIDATGGVPYNPKLGDSEANTYVTLREANEYIKNSFYHPDQWDNLTLEGRKRVLIQAAKDIDAFNYRDKPYYDSQALAFPRSDHETYTGTASINTATTGTLRALNLYSSSYNEIPDNYFKTGTVHIKAGNNYRQVRVISSSTASKAGGFGEVTLSSPFDSNVVASDQYIVFKPIYQEIKDAQCEQAIYIIAEEFYKYADYVHAGIGYVRTGDLGISFKDPQKGVPDSKVCVKSRRLLGRFMRKTLMIGRA
jgi:hypothetical protein